MNYGTAYDAGVRDGMAEMERRMRPQRVLRGYMIDGYGTLSGVLVVIETLDGRTWVIPDEADQQLTANSPHLRKEKVG